MLTKFWNIHMRYNNEKTTEYDFILASKGLISIYWKTGPLYKLLKIKEKKASIDEIFDILKTNYPDYKDSTFDNWKTSIYYFVCKSQIGDFVISPTIDKRIYLGMIQSNYFWDGQFHYKKVEWSLISREKLSEDLNSSIGTPRTMHSLKSHKEEIINLYLDYCIN